MKTFEEQRQLIAQMNLMDDLLFQKVAEDREACEEMLRILLNKPGLQVVETQPQRYLRNIGAHSVILDLLCQEASGDLIAVEVQKADDDHHQKRMRFNISNVDTSFVEKGISYRELPDIYAIFLSQFDPFREKKTLYHVDRSLRETGSRVENGIHELYVNTAVYDGTIIAELMQYFRKTEGIHPKFEKLSRRVQYYKEQKEGVGSMSDVVEEYAKKYAKEHAKDYVKDYVKDYIEEYAKREIKETQKESAIRLFQKGVSLELVKESLTVLSEKELEELQKQVLESQQ